MSQKIFVYALYHPSNIELDRKLRQIDAVDEVLDLSTRNSTACRGKDPISDKRTTALIRIVEEAEFEDIDNALETHFDEKWLENIV